MVGGALLCVMRFGPLLARVITSQIQLERARFAPLPPSFSCSRTHHARDLQGDDIRKHNCQEVLRWTVANVLIVFQFTELIVTWQNNGRL